MLKTFVLLHLPYIKENCLTMRKFSSKRKKFHLLMLTFETSLYYTAQHI